MLQATRLERKHVSRRDRSAPTERTEAQALGADRRRRLRRHRRCDRAAGATASKSVTILERAPDLGGTWFYNSYPGAACDVPSHLYSFSFAQRRDWSRLCSPQAEIHDYLRDVAREHDIARHVRCGQTVSACTWEEQRALWTVETAEGERFEADALVLATGQLHQPAHPSIAGIDSFAGHSFHSAQWDHDYDLRGKRVAVVGTGASAVQFVPEIAEQVGAADASSSAPATGSCRGATGATRGSCAPRSNTSRACRRSGATSCSSTASCSPPRSATRARSGDWQGCARRRSCARS